MEFLLQEFAGWQGGQILRNVDAARVEFEEFDLFRLFPGAEDDAEGRVLSGLLLVFGEPAEVELHLAFVFGFEVAELEVDGDEAFQAAVVEEVVEVEVALEVVFEGDDLFEVRPTQLSRQCSKTLFEKPFGQGDFRIFS